MLTNRKYPLLRTTFFCCVLCTCFSRLSAQAVWENYRNEIYNYLSRMAQKGLIRFDDIIRPVRRQEIASNLQILLQKQDQLSSVEKKELDFYLKEYPNPNDTLPEHAKELRLFRKDDFGRWRTAVANNRDIALYVDAMVGGGITAGNGKSYTDRNIGAQLWGRIGKHVGFQFYGNDISYSGNGQQALIHPYNPAPGNVLQSDTAKKNFSEIRGSITYQWKNGNISLGQDYLLWGYGLNGRMVLSDKAPAYPYLRLDYQPFKWLSFNYTHAWLNSDVIDSSRTYRFGNGAYGGQRIIYVPKYMAQHTITVKPIPKLDISLGESIVYSDNLDIGYLLPVMFFKIYDNIRSNNNIAAGNNGQFFLQASARHLLPKTFFYSTIFIDEIRFGKIFDKTQSRNQLGFNFGASVTDAFIPYLTLNAEYARINPFVYSNLNPAQLYTNHSYSLGDWMGNNMDRMILSAAYTPIPRLKCLIQYQGIRKGGAGSIYQQYFVQPSPSFLFDPQFKTHEWLLQCSYEWIHNLYVQGYLNLYRQTNQVTGLRTNQQIFHLGIHYGL